MAGTIIIRDSRKPRLLSEDLQTYLSTLECRMYTNLIAPDPTAGTGQFTELTDSGYVPQIPTFNVPVQDGVQGLIEAPPLTFMMSGSGAGGDTIQGVYYTDPADGDEWVYGFQALVGVLIPPGGTPVVVLPQFRSDMI